MGRHHGAGAIRQDRGLEGGRSRLVLDDGFGFDNFERDALGQLNANRIAVEDAENDLHAFLQEDLLIADHIIRNIQLLIAGIIHEVIAVAIGIEIAEFIVFDESALDLFGRLVAHAGLHAIRQAAHVDLGRGRALAGVEALSGEDDIEIAVFVLNDVALADRTGDDSHVMNSLVDGGRGAAYCRAS